MQCCCFVECWLTCPLHEHPPAVPRALCKLRALCLTCCLFLPNTCALQEQGEERKRRVLALFADWCAEVR